MAITKAHVLDAVAETSGLPKSDSAVIVEPLIEIITSRPAADEDVLLSGFGKYCVNKKRAPLPKTGAMPPSRKMP